MHYDPVPLTYISHSSDFVIILFYVNPTIWVCFSASMTVDATLSIGPSLCSMIDGHHFLSK